MSIHSHSDALAFLNGRSSRRLPGRSTWLERDGETIAVRYHHTRVVIYRVDGTVRLQTDGYESVTTRRRINTYAPHGVRLFTDRGTSRIVYAGDSDSFDRWVDRSYRFTDHAELTSNGQRVDPLSEWDILDRMRRIETAGVAQVSVDEWRDHPYAVEYRALMKLWWTIPNDRAYQALTDYPAFHNRRLTERGCAQPGFHFSPRELREVEQIKVVRRRLLGD